MGRSSWRWMNHSPRLLWSISSVGEGLEIIQDPCPGSHPADVLGNSGWGALFLFSLAERGHLVPFGVCFGGKRERRVLRVLSCRRRVLPKEGVSAPLPRSAAGSDPARAPLSTGGCCELLGRAAAVPTAVPTLFVPGEPSPAARGPSSSPGHLWDGEQSCGRSWNRAERTGAFSERHPIPAVSLRWLHPFRTHLPDGRDRRPTRRLPAGPFLLSSRSSLGPSIQLEGRSWGFRESQR